MTNKLGYFNALKDTYSALADFPFGAGLIKSYYRLFLSNLSLTKEKSRPRIFTDFTDFLCLCNCTVAIYIQESVGEKYNFAYVELTLLKSTSCKLAPAWGLVETTKIVPQIRGEVRRESRIRRIILFIKMC